VSQNIIYTNENDCQDCYKCVRNCPVNAISMVDSHASIDDDRCIYCGNCIRICPVGAQKYRNDESRVKELLLTGRKVIMSLAPSFVSEFNIDNKVLINIIKQLGFYGVSETALGAQIVSNVQRDLLKSSKTPIFSTACPTFVQLIMKYYPELKENLSSLFSPLLSHCKMLRKLYGDDIAIVFVGPCLAKKFEADSNPALLDISITFDELKSIIENSDINMEKAESDDGMFIPTHSNGGAIYPLDGGMVETIKDLKPASVADSSFFHFAGIATTQKLLKSENFKLNPNLFCEFLACEGGCINGSGIFDDEPIITKKNRVSNYYKSLPAYSEESFIEKYAPDSIETSYDLCKPVKIKNYTLKEKETIWLQLGKCKKEDFIDCGSCGYNTCDNFAIACLEKRAELEMCAVSMRKKAQEKTNSLMRAIPVGLCVVTESMRILECNDTFIDLSTDVDIDITDKVLLQVVGSEIDKFFSLSDEIKSVFRSKERMNTLLHKDNRIFDAILFPLGGNNNVLTGLIIQDITKPSMKRDVVIRKSEAVIKDNLLTVQKIAFLLGETAAKTEISLNEVIDAYKTKGEVNE